MNPASTGRRIRQLPPTVVTKIAAGEVIERPASVVKELLENAVDAGSTRIEVELEQGGVELIRVVDNGHGILPDDLPLAFASHATSKLDTADDLFRIGTLGFRGEALASIGGVAQVLLQSRAAGQGCGAEVTCHGGTLSEPRIWNGAAGTRIEVKHLFYNTPVRRKFLRTTQTEMGHVCEMFTRLALSHMDIHWVLRHGNRAVYEVPATASLADRIGLFFGAEVRDVLYEIDTKAGPARLHGFVADPSCDRGNAKLQYLFLNGRWIRDRSLGHAMQEAYRGLLMTGRYAVTFLFLELPPDQVDVNVHPTKAEVRFRDASAAYHLVLTAIRERLRAEQLTARLEAPMGAVFPANTQAPLPERSSTGFVPVAPPGFPTQAGPDAEEANGVASEFPAVRDSEGGTAMLPPPGVATPPVLLPPPGSFKAIQLYDSYIVLETPEGMLVIDQHALHERVLFEQFKQRIRTGPMPAQRLLIPEPVELGTDHAARLLEHKEALAELGLEVEDFGNGTVLLSSYPAILGQRNPGTILRAVLDHLVSQDRLPPREVLLNDILSLMACHAAVKAGDHLTPEEMAALVAQRELANDTHHCPHGRPTALLFTRHELERQFRRV